MSGSWGKGKNKRKANSPLDCEVDNSDRDSRHSGQTGSVGGVSKTKNNKKTSALTILQKP